MIAHSTSWRYEADGLILTHLVVVAEPRRVQDGWEVVPVRRYRLARGSATEPPATIEAEEVIDHALRHLAWLSVDDQAVGDALRSDWKEALRVYRPAPFFCTDELEIAIAQELAPDA
ncbi:MAG TPA: hypothetical protein VHL09_07495 [Dehalococcoidia bacterium]|nr:hypothetical protein [Dehalococcoidia bacterium]